MSTNSEIIEFEFVAGRGYRRNFAQNELPERIHMGEFRAHIDV